MLSPSLALPEKIEARPVVDVLSSGFRSRYLYIDDEHEIRLSGARLSRRHADAVREGAAEFALVIEEPVIFLCARFGDLVPWTVSSYSWHLVPREHRTLPPLPCTPRERRAFLAVSLTAEEDDAVQATRNVTLSLDFTRALNEAIRDQARLAFNVHSYHRALAELQRRYTSDHAIAAKASIRSFGSP